MDTTWILVADSSRARIFEKKEQDEHLQEIEDLVDTEGRATSSELRTGELGRFYGKDERGQANTADPTVFPVQHENEIFSRTLTQYLDKGRNEHRYKRLYLIAPPKFLGLIRSNLNEQVEKLVEKEFPKDISTFTIRQIEDYINTH
jgi:protein required for attachment to host cells